MSNYFDGLIRASGFALRTDPQVAADPVIIEIDVQTDAPPPATPAVRAGARMDTQRSEIITPPPVAAPTLPKPAIREYAAPPRTEHTELAFDRPLPTSPASAPDPRGETSMAPGLPTPPASASNARPQAAAPDPGQAMMHAALRWVTAAVQSPSALTEIALTPEPTPPDPDPAQALTTHKITPPARPSVSPPEAGPVPGATTLPPDAPIPLRVAPIRHPASTDQPPPWASGTRRPTTHDEEVEITIGAIHLRVDSPTPQTVVQAPAPTPRPPVDRPPPRSGLARRALRRL